MFGIELTDEERSRFLMSVCLRLSAAIPYLSVLANKCVGLKYR